MLPRSCAQPRLGGWEALDPPPPLGWLAGWRAPRKQQKYVVHNCTASCHAWYGYGDGFARVGGD